MENMAASFSVINIISVEVLISHIFFTKSTSHTVIISFVNCKSTKSCSRFNSIKGSSLSENIMVLILFYVRVRLEWWSVVNRLIKMSIHTIKIWKHITWWWIFTIFIFLLVIKLQQVRRFFFLHRSRYPVDLFYIAH